MIPWRLVTACAALFVAISCGTEQAGTPTAADSATETSSTPTAEPVTPTTSSATGPALTEIDPCELLTSAELAQLTLPGGDPDTRAGNRACVWNQPGDRAVVSVTLNANNGIDDLNPGSATKVEEVTIGGHTGRRLEDPDGYCVFDLAITATSSVTIATLIRDKIVEACAFAQRVVGVVEPKLPKA